MKIPVPPEGCAVKVTDAVEVDLSGTDPACGLIQTIDTSAGTVSVLIAGVGYGRLGAAYTAGTSVEALTPAADSRLDPASAGDKCIARALGMSDGADGELVEVFVNFFELET